MTPCRDLVLTGKATTEDWFPSRPKPNGQWKVSETAKTACKSCPVARECFDRAVENGEQEGVWAGFNFGDQAERRVAIEWHGRTAVRPPRRFRARRTA